MYICLILSWTRRPCHCCYLIVRRQESFGGGDAHQVLYLRRVSLTSRLDYPGSEESHFFLVLVVVPVAVIAGAPHVLRKITPRRRLDVNYLPSKNSDMCVPPRMRRSWLTELPLCLLGHPKQKPLSLVSVYEMDKIYLVCVHEPARFVIRRVKFLLSVCTYL